MTCQDGASEVVSTMNAYDISREDWDNILAISNLHGDANTKDNLETNVKSAFTRLYNAEGVVSQRVTVRFSTIWLSVWHVMSKMSDLTGAKNSRSHRTRRAPEVPLAPLKSLILMKNERWPFYTVVVCHFRIFTEISSFCTRIFINFLRKKMRYEPDIKIWNPKTHFWQENNWLVVDREECLWWGRQRWWRRWWCQRWQDDQTEKSFGQKIETCAEKNGRKREKTEKNSRQKIQEIKIRRHDDKWWRHQML